MINSREILVECNLKSSVVNNDNSFTTTIGGGIQLEEGDSIEISDVAVNSKGIGNNLIQIPKSNKDSAIQTNKIIFKVGKYITTGNRFCCPLPFDTYSIITDKTDVGYGYASKSTNINTDTYTAQGGLPYMTPDFVETFKTFRGNHQYADYPYINNISNDKELCIKLHSVIAPKTTPDYNSSVLPYDILVDNLYEMESDDCRVEIPQGYEQEQNIARLITDQFHSGQISAPNSVIPRIMRSGGTNPTQTAINTSITNAFLKIKSANGIDSRVRHFTDADPPVEIIGQYENALYDNLYHRDPNRWIYGERLNHLTEIYNKQFPMEDEPSPPTKVNNIISYVGGIQVGSITITNILSQNLIFNSTLRTEKNNIRLLVDFMTKNEKYVPNNAVYNNTVATDYEKDSLNWFIYMDIGRYNDATSLDNTSNTSAITDPVVGGVALQPNWLVNRQNGGDAELGKVLQSKIGYFSRYNENIYSTKKLNASDIRKGFFFVEEFEYNGETINVKQFLIKNNIMFCLLGNTLDSTLKGGNCLIGLMTGGYTDERIYVDESEYSYKPISDIDDMDGDKIDTLDHFSNQYFGFDPTFMGNTIAIAINTSKNNGDAKDMNVVLNYCNFIQSGSPNSALLYDTDLNRFGFSNLHFPLFDVVDDNGTSVVALMREYNILTDVIATKPDYPLLPYPKTATVDAVINTPIYWGHSGSTILGLEGNLDTEPSLFKNNVEITENTFQYTFLKRLGFSYNDLFGLGDPSALYNSSTANNFVKHPYQTPNPMTTNAKIITTYSYAMGVDYMVLGGITPNTDSYDLNINCNVNSNTNAESVSINASNLSQRLDNPYWLVQSNIIPSSNYISDNGRKQNILSVVNRAYTSNDYAYGMGSTTAYTVENPTVITEITTTLFNNDFTLPYLDDGCVVIYKITKNYQRENAMIQLLNQKK